MISRNSKLFIGVFILLAYMSIGVFGLIQLNHTNEMPMPNCPYAQNGFSICENSLSHINDWRQFSNAIFPALFLFSLLALGMGIILYFFGKQKLSNQKQYFYRWKYYLYNKKLDTYDNKIIKWLSLFEKSPSLSYVRHS